MLGHNNIRPTPTPCLASLSRPSMAWACAPAWLRQSTISSSATFRPNHYIGCPEQQKASPNTAYKHLIYELRERGLNELISRRLASKRVALEPDERPRKRRRNRAFAYHRAHSYYHEIIVDLGYYLPLRYLVRSDPALRLVDLAQLLQHANVPTATRQSQDPLLITLRDAEKRFDGTPHVLARKALDDVEYTLCVPGIQVDRGTETLGKVEDHILHALEFVEDRHYDRHWGFQNCVIPFLFTKQTNEASPQTDEVYRHNMSWG